MGINDRVLGSPNISNSSRYSDVKRSEQCLLLGHLEILTVLHFIIDKWTQSNIAKMLSRCLSHILEKGCNCFIISVSIMERFASDVSSN